MTMTDKQFYFAMDEALTSSDRDTYVSDLALSSVFVDDPSNPPEEIDAELIGALGNIWDVAHMSIAEIRRATGLSQVAFCERFLLPRRTLQHWELDERECATYLRVLLADACGLLNVRREGVR